MDAIYLKKKYIRKLNPPNMNLGMYITIFHWESADILTLKTVDNFYVVSAHYDYKSARKYYFEGMDSDTIKTRSKSLKEGYLQNPTAFSGLMPYFSKDLVKWLEA